MALFGTNCTPFVLVGIPGLAYGAGIGVFGLNAPIIALGIPLSFWAIGSPARRMARRLGALTPAELYAKRLGSRAVGALLFAFFTLWTLPYMVGGIKGVAVSLEKATGGEVPAWLGGLAVLAVALTYTMLGGMRATAWTNVFQGFLFLTFMVVAIFFVAASLGGWSAATGAVAAQEPDLLRVAGQSPLFAPGAWASWGMVITFTVIAFPHMLVRLMAARDDRAMRQVCRLYPLALILLWTPAVLLGVWGAAAFPGLENGDEIFARMTLAHLPAWLAPVGSLAVIAAVMSTLDAQLLTLGSMLTRDVVDPLRQASVGAADRGRAGHRDVLEGRAFTLAIGVLVYLLAQVWDESVFAISRKAFEGYVMLVPTLLLGVRWRRFNAPGAIASLLVGHAVLVLGWAGPPLVLGMLPVFWAFLAGLAAGVVGSLATGPEAPEWIEAAFGPT